jgi:STE24 endopeptidase
MPLSEIEAIEHPVLDQARQVKARQYSRKHHLLSLIETGISLLLLLILVFGGVSKWLAGLLHLPYIPTAIVYFVVLMLIFEILTFPLSYYAGFVMPHRYGISIQNLRSWLADLAKSGLLGLVLGSASVAIAFWLISDFPDYWWLMAWVLMIGFSLIMTVIGPIFLVPLFYKVKPLEQGELKSRLAQLAARAGAKVQGIFTLDFSVKVKTANAGLMGMGKTRRIVISDTLIQQYSLPEIEVITAHEIGHHLHRDIFRMFVIQSAVFLIGLKVIDIAIKATAAPLGYSGISDPAVLPLLMLILGVIGALGSPLLNGYTRLVENQADEYALNLTNDSKAFIDSMTRLVNQNLAVAFPPVWEEVLFHDHPSYGRRVGHAKAFETNISKINNP